MKKLLLFIISFSFLSASEYYGIQVGAFKNDNFKHNGMLDNIKKHNLEYKVIEKDGYYKLIVGNYKNQDEARTYIQTIYEHVGQKGFVVKVKEIEDIKIQKEIVSNSNIQNINQQNYIAKEQNVENDDSLYYIQVLTVSNQEDIESALIESIYARGYKYKIVYDNNMYKLIIGPFNSKNSAIEPLYDIKSSIAEEAKLIKEIPTTTVYKENNQPKTEKQTNIIKNLDRKYYAGGLVGLQTNNYTVNGVNAKNSLIGGVKGGFRLNDNLSLEGSLLFSNPATFNINSQTAPLQVKFETNPILNLGIKYRYEMLKELYGYTNGGASITKQNVSITNNTNTDEIVVNPYAGVGAEYSLDKAFLFGIGYDRVFGLDLNNFLFSINYNF
ncbi:MAG: SPOR domain-containing protein [Campylobacterales bacterium]|nr:SPOR domain-containing protein [Campylobacterales bacterium]